MPNGSQEDAVQAHWLDDVEPGAAVAEDMEADDWPIRAVADDAVQELIDAFEATDELSAAA